MNYIGFSDVAGWKDLRVGVGFIGGAGLVVQGYECCLGMAEVGGSIPSQSTILKSNARACVIQSCIFRSARQHLYGICDNHGCVEKFRSEAKKPNKRRNRKRRSEDSKLSINA